MNILLSVDRATDVASPTDATLQGWVSQTLIQTASVPEPTPELCIRITDNDEAAALNQTYRAKPGATNVLSFPADVPTETGSGLLGDLVICAPLVQLEALQQQKSEEAHWAHLVIHGVLHLLGHDHQIPAEAAQMEAIEIYLLGHLGFPNPYDPERLLEGLAT